jgi:hypothetical protein
LAGRLDRAGDPADVVRIVSENPAIANDPSIQSILYAEEKTDKERADSLKAAIEMRAMLESPAAKAPPVAQVSRIKSSPMYRDSGVDQTSNWLSRALERLKNIKFERNNKPVNMGWLAALGPALYALFWAAIAASLFALVYFTVRHFRWRQRLERKASALLEESEPERTLDEWLELAAKLEQEGKYREAVRALYLACLLRFDEALVARFDRAQTNWEHLGRIEKSDKKPADLDFRTPTKHFDRIWYGYHVRGPEDVAQFRTVYVQITDLLRRTEP